MPVRINEISSLFFEIGSEQRLSIILHLKEKPWTVSSLAKELDATITEVHRNFGRLQKTGLISKNMNGTYNLTLKGIHVCLQIPSISFVLENNQYFETHNFGGLPIKFQNRVGELVEGKRIKGFVRVLEKWKDIHNNANQYIYNILTEVPYSMDIIDIIEEKLKNKIKIQSIFSQNTIIPEARKNLFQEKNFLKYVKEELLVRRIIDEINVIVLLNENESCVIFPSSNGEVDMSEMIYSKKPEFHEWCLDYFNYIWKRTKPFQETKLQTTI